VAQSWSAVESVVYDTLRTVLGSAARAYFEKIEVHHAERIPERGPLLVAANHPAALTDALVLAPSLPRRFHFVAYSGMFRWPLGWLLRLSGTVPVYRQRDAAEDVHRNEETFRACSSVFEDGGAVLIFPEGHSLHDRQIERLRTGTARMAFAYEFAAS
jgi:1-acyl-sn-glycerol-3-phosphate acyltransferase